MNIASQLPQPINTFVVDVPAKQFYDFHLPLGSTYPLSGVTYPVDYGHIPGYTAEDGADLDVFVGNGSDDGKSGSITVNRGEIAPSECKFYVGCTDEDLAAILEVLQPVLLDHTSFKDVNELFDALKIYKDEA